MEQEQSTVSATSDSAETTVTAETKFCKECGKVISKKAVICPHCGCQIEEISGHAQQPQIVINNSNQNVNENVNQNVGVVVHGRPRNKWVALILLLCLGLFGAHKFYEGKTGMGLLYLFTGGLFFVGVVIDFFVLLGKPNPYYV